MAAKGMMVVIGLAVVLFGAMAAVATVRSESHRDAGWMQEVVVTAQGPAMMLDEVVVRPVDLTGATMPEVVVSAPGPRLLAAARRVVPTGLN